jgi:oxygen-independent coproporphyrinogen-3 oxidase
VERLLHSRFGSVARNTIDYWMKRDRNDVSYDQVVSAIESAPWLAGSTLQLYVHVPYCAQRCSFCAFSGGNSLDFKSGERYSRLVVWDMQQLVARTRAAGQPIRAVNIGGGSPDLLRGHLGYVLRAVRDLPGVSDSTEISVEFTLSTVKDDFIEQLCKYGVTKASFGVQSMDPEIRKNVRMPVQLKNMDATCKRLRESIPIVNVDLITGLPGQTLGSVLNDLQHFIDHPYVNSISTYLLTAGAAPRLVADVSGGRVPAQPSQAEQALLRLHSYTTLQRQGWVRKGTNTYMNPRKIKAPYFDMVVGNECIGARRYQDFLIGAGAQACSSLPGIRFENTVDLEAWSRDVEQGRHSFSLEKSSFDHQRDMALWVFPLMSDGLAVAEYDEMVSTGAIDAGQISTFESCMQEGLIMRAADRYQLTIVGEVFMGHLVRELKKPEDRAAVDEYIEEGHVLGKLLAADRLRDSNAANNRQIFKQLVASTGERESAAE